MKKEKSIKSGQTYESWDYEAFKTMKENREVVWSHVDDIIESIRVNGWLDEPIKINQNWEIIDGQNRYWALRKLNLPIYFRVFDGGNINTVVVLNTKKRNWKDVYYLRKWAKHGVESYIFIYNLYNEYKQYCFTVGGILKIATLSQRVQISKLREGKLITGDKEEVLLVLSHIINIKKILSNSANPKTRSLYKNSSFISAYIACWNASGFDAKRMDVALKNRGNQLFPSGDATSFINNLVHLYNHGLSVDKRINVKN